MDEPITKRIHISGLTPAITQQDLSNRLSSFGTVKSIDGFGLLDGVGQPRKFAYATLETTKGKLSRCMTLLSGVTWKGAKLRLGEAKLDFRERILKEQADLKRSAEASSDGPPKKRRRLPHGVQGVHAYDMSLVTPDNAATRGKWRVTATGRVLRPMRMRPSHPLPAPLDAAKPEKAKSNPSKDRKRTREPPTRARRKTIDPTRWGSQHLKGIFLENAAVIPYPRPVPPKPTLKEPTAASISESEVEEEEEEEVEEVEEAEEAEEESAPDTSDLERPAPAPTKPQPATLPPTVSSAKPSPPTTANDLDSEKKHSLGLLHSMFGDGEEWGGAESVGSDVDEDDISTAQVPVSAEPTQSVESVNEPMEVDEQTPAESPQEQIAESGVQKTKLKDLFAPREEEAGFSLLGHLDLDLELEDDVPFDIPAPTPSTALARPLAIAQPAPASAPHLTFFDASRPFFFPTEQAGTKRSALDPTNWRTWFYRTDTPEAIRARWDETKGELTAGWKRRHREAVKSRRRRGGGGDAD